MPKKSKKKLPDREPEAKEEAAMPIEFGSSVNLNENEGWLTTFFI